MSAERKSRRGPKPVDLALLRLNCVSTRLNDQELHVLDRERGAFFRGEWLRMAALGKLPTVVPPINSQSYLELGRIGNNLNQIARLMNEGNAAKITEIKAVLDELRLSLLGAIR